MDHLVTATRTAVREKNWHAALALALTLPDICARLQSPEVQSSRVRYVKWCEAHLAPRYTFPIGAEGVPHVFLGGDDCYALRCAVLHEGADNIVGQRARKALEEFVFSAPPTGGGMIHCNQVDSKLQLQVDIFCLDVCAGVEEWVQEVARKDAAVNGRMAGLMLVHDASGGISF